MNIDVTQVFLALLSAGAAILGWLYRQILADMKELRHDLKVVEAEASKMREEIPAKYAQIGVMERMFERLDAKMDQMLDKLDKKADKP
jgi:hypothetical protein